MKNGFRSVQISIAIVSTAIVLVAGCATVPTATHTVAAPAAAGSLDLLDVAIAAARDVDLPAVTKHDKANGVVEFGSFDTASKGYSAQVRQRPEGGLAVTVKGGAGAPGSVEDKARAFVAALDARLTQAPAPPLPASPAAPGAAPSPPPAPPSAPAPPAAPSRQEPAPPPPPPSDTAITLVIGVPRANLRAGGDLKARVIRLLTKNTRLTVLGKANQWYLVRLDDGTEGWVAESVTAPAR
ncbi:MAG TPA: SH3 domain-containing protein [Candidatus Limnocylindria bacterium]|nr:SH3 domain-containing protein [Candidatus Limnocylindria bacterium]